MANLKEFDELTRKVKIIMELDEEIREVEDEYLDAWLTEGMPDGEPIGELFRDAEECGNEWIELGTRLLEMREKEE